MCHISFLFAPNMVKIHGTRRVLNAAVGTRLCLGSLNNTTCYICLCMRRLSIPGNCVFTVHYTFPKNLVRTRSSTIRVKSLDVVVPRPVKVTV